MSTVINNGFATDETQLEKLFEVLNEMKDLVSVQTRNKIFKELSETFIDHFYTRFFEPEKEGEHSPFGSLSHYLKNLPEDEFVSRVVLFPGKGKTLLTIHTPLSSAEEEKLMTTDTGFRPYYFWNNSDAEPAVSKEEWEERKNDWEIVRSGPASDQGFSFLLYSPNNVKYFVFEDKFKESVFNQFGDLDKFKYDLAFRRAMNEYCTGETTGAFIRQFEEFRTLMDTDDSLVQEKLLLLKDINSWDDVANKSRAII